MRKIIDFENYLPPDEQGNTRNLVGGEHRIGYGDPELLPEMEGYGFANYKHIFKNSNKKDNSQPERKVGDAFQGRSRQRQVIDMTTDVSVAIRRKNGVTKYGKSTINCYQKQ